MTNKANNLWQLLQQCAAEHGNKTFLIDAVSQRSLTFKQFSQQAEQVAQQLYQYGVSQGLVVAWQMPTSIEASLLMFALSRLGAIQAPIIHLYREREVQEILQQSRPHLVVVLDDENSQQRQQCVQKAIDALPYTPTLIDYRTLTTVAKTPSLPEFKPTADTVSWYFFTSGTTARPKGALHSDQSLIAGGFFLANALRVSSDDVGSIAYPIAHIGGAIYFTMALKAGIAVVLLANYSPPLVIDSFNRYQVSLAGGSTAHYQVLLEQQRKQPDTPLFPSLRLISGGGAAKPAALYWQVKEELGVRIIHAYGMTEAPITSSNTPDDSDEQLTHTDGEVLPELELKIINPEGKNVRPGEIGEVILRGTNVCKGYLLEEQTQAAFDDKGFYHTGDLGRMDFDGHLSITGRLKDIIIRKGENISAREIEELLAKHPSVNDVAVIGLPDEERGELVCAVIQPNANTHISFEQMQQFLQDQQLMRQKIPERLEIMTSLPRSESLQKVKKNVLREQLMAD